MNSKRMTLSKLTNIIYHIDSVEVVGKRCLVSGWVFNKNGEDVNLTVDRIKFAPQIICTRRDDVVAFYSRFMVKAECGFTLDFDCNNVKKIILVFKCNNAQISYAINLNKIKRRMLYNNVEIYLQGDNGALKSIGSFIKYGIKDTLSSIIRSGNLPYLCPKRELNLQRGFHFPYEPLISIIVPVFNPQNRFLIEMLDSVIAQTYTNWELCIADGNSNSDIISILKSYTQNNHKIKVRYLDKNYNISINTNEALRLISGDYIGFLDHDDLITPDCLFEYVKAINEHKSAALFYCDEDKTDEDTSIFYKPFLKSNFTIDTLRNNNYITHFTVVRYDVLQKIGELHSRFDGAQDYDLILRVIDECEYVVHIPKILYHWREHINSTSCGVDAKPYTNDAGKLALKDHLIRRGIQGDVIDGVIPNIYKINYTIEQRPLVQIIILADKLERLLKSLDFIWTKTLYTNFEVIIVIDYIKKSDLTAILDRDVLLYQKLEIISSSGLKSSIEASDAEHLLFLDGNAEVLSTNWLNELLMYSQRSDVGIVGAKILLANGKIQNAGFNFKKHKMHPRYTNKYKNFILANFICNVQAVQSCFMIKKSLFLNYCNPLDILKYDNFAICLSITNARYLVVYNPYCELCIL